MGSASLSVQRWVDDVRGSAVPLRRPSPVVHGLERGLSPYEGPRADQGRSTTAMVSRGGVWVESYGREWYHSRTRLPNDPKYDTEVRTGAFEDNR